MSETIASEHPSRPARRGAVRLWIPDQPGAWVMALLPALAGVVVGGPDPARLWLVGEWLLCYCVQFAAARWLRSRFARRYLPPAATYAVLLAVTGLPFLILHPQVLVWAPAYVVFAGVTLLAAWMRRDRALWADAASVLATSMMAVVVATLDKPTPLQQASGVAIAAVFALTQFGSVLFVKTMIRERGDRRYLLASWLWHAMLVAVSGVAAWFGGAAGVPLVVIAVALLLRAIVLPAVGRRRRLRPIVPGMVEMVMSPVIFVYAVMAVPLLVL